MSEKLFSSITHFRYCLKFPWHGPCCPWSCHQAHAEVPAGWVRRPSSRWTSAGLWEWGASPWNASPTQSQLPICTQWPDPDHRIAKSMLSLLYLLPNNIQPENEKEKLQALCRHCLSLPLGAWQLLLQCTLRVLALNPDVTAAGNTKVCCEKESRKFDFATYHLRETKAPGSGQHTPLCINASYICLMEAEKYQIV